VGTRRCACGEASPSAAPSLAIQGIADALVEPVTNILARVELMLLESAERLPTTGTVDDLQMIGRHVRRLAHVVATLRYAAGDPLSGWLPFRLNEVVTRAARANGLAERIGFLDPGDPMVLGDAGALEQALADLLTAAPGPVSSDDLGVGTGRCADRPGRVEVTIRGLPEMAAIGLASRSVLENHTASMEARAGPDEIELVLSFPLFTLSLPEDPP
jgi:hypothetical protein